MGGTTHAATAAPTRMPSENTATAIRTAPLSLLSSSAATPGGSKYDNCGCGAVSLSSDAVSPL
jgi:hypothetical protein